MALRIEGGRGVPVGRLVRYHGTVGHAHGVYRIAAGCDCRRCDVAWDKAWKAAYAHASPGRRVEPEPLYVAHTWRYVLEDPKQPGVAVLRCVGQDSVTAID